jgi:hypothetical protein
MNFLRQLRGITRKPPTAEKLARSNHESVVTAIGYEKGEEADNSFDYYLTLYANDWIYKLMPYAMTLLFILLLTCADKANSMISDIL